VRPRPALACIAGVGLAVALVAACSSSSGGGTADGGLQDSSAPSDASGEASPVDAGNGDVGGGDGGVCVGLDAATSSLNVPAACLACIGAHCCSQAQACAATSGCVQIEACATACVATGTAPMTCAVMCIEGDSGIPEGGQLSPAQSAAESLDVCLAATCSTYCS
jgi:hypothetical protein